MARKSHPEQNGQLDIFGQVSSQTAAAESAAPPQAQPSDKTPADSAQQATPPPVSIVIPNWNGWKLLERFLPSVLAALEHYTGGGEIVVVDDGSTDHSGVLLRERFPSVRAVELGFNRGFSAAVNRGVQETLYDIIILLNNDVGVAEDFIAPLVRHFGVNDVFAVGAKSLDWDRERFHDGGKLGRWQRGFWRVWQNYDCPAGQVSEGLELPSFYTPGGFAAFDKNKWSELGGLDELFRPFNWEDTDICHRALKRDWKVLYEPASLVYHRPNTTIAGGAFRRGYVRYISRRNRIFFHWKNLTDRRMLAEHLFFLALSVPLSLLRLDFPSVGAVFGALTSLGKIRERRREEKVHAVVSDRELRRRFHAFPGETPVEIR